MPQNANVRLCKEADVSGTPKGIRTPVAGLKGLCPRPLDDEGTMPNDMALRYD